MEIIVGHERTKDEIHYRVRRYGYDPANDTHESSTPIPSHVIDRYWNKQIGNKKGSTLAQRISSNKTRRSEWRSTGKRKPNNQTTMNAASKLKPFLVPPTYESLNRRQSPLPLLHFYFKRHSHNSSWTLQTIASKMATYDTASQRAWTGQALFESCSFPALQHSGVRSVQAKTVSICGARSDLFFVGWDKFVLCSLIRDRSVPHKSVSSV